MGEIWEIDYFNQDGSSDPNSKDLVATVRPENLQFTFQEGQNGPHEVNSECSRYAKDDDGNFIVEDGFIGPYRSDFALRRSDLTNPLITGMVTPYGGADPSEDHVKISGKSYLHYLERRHWPYDPGDGETPGLSYVNWPDGFRFKVADADTGQIIKDILETVRDLSPNFPDPPGSTLATRSFSLDFTVDVDDTGHNINYEITPFESQSIYELIKSLSEGVRADKAAFDFYMTWDKVFRLVYPEVGDPAHPVLFLEVDVETGKANMTAAQQTNTGPQCTHVLGVGAGTSTKAGGVNRHFRHNSSIFRRLDEITDFGDVKNLGALISLTAGTLSFGANPVHEVSIEVDPNQIPHFWQRVRPPGQYVMVDYDLGYARINSVQKIVSIDCTVTPEGDETAVLNLNQHYNVDSSTGLADW
jgi:hypothetical protein